jgi:hypothetical protein
MMRRRQREHRLGPAEGELARAMEQHDGSTLAALEDGGRDASSVESPLGDRRPGAQSRTEFASGWVDGRGRGHHQRPYGCHPLAASAQLRNFDADRRG